MNTSMLYRVRTLTSHNVEESENSPESPHLGEIKRMRKQCVPGASPFFARAGDEATQLHACCVCDTLPASREATNLIVVEKLLPLLN